MGFEARQAANRFSEDRRRRGFFCREAGDFLLDNHNRGPQQSTHVLDRQSMSGGPTGFNTLAIMLRSDEGQSPQPQVFLRRNDQLVLGAVAFCALAGMALLWHVRGGPAGELVELEQMRRESMRFQADINRADWTELSELPGIGETLAKRIVEYRTAHGPFQKIDELRQVRGVGPKILERIRPYLVSLEEPPAP